MNATTGHNQLCRLRGNICRAKPLPSSGGIQRTEYWANMSQVWRGARGRHRVLQPLNAAAVIPILAQPKTGPIRAAGEPVLDLSENVNLLPGTANLATGHVHIVGYLQQASHAPPCTLFALVAVGMVVMGASTAGFVALTPWGPRPTPRPA